MKILKNNILVGAVLICVALTTSCKKSFFTDANINPNAPDSASIIPSTMLSTVEGTLAYVQGGDISRYTSLITQQTLGGSRHPSK